MYLVPDTVRATHCQDGGIILAIHTGQVLRLNPTGSLVFGQLQQGATESEIINAVSATFGISTKVAATDVRDFLEALEELALIHKCLSPRERADIGSDLAEPRTSNGIWKDEQLG